MTLTGQAAVAYAKRGWYVFPCRADKTPHTAHGVLDSTIDTDQIKTWWETWPNANVAIDTGKSGFMVLDLDPGWSQDELERNVGADMHATQLHAKTPRGGEHLFYRLPEGEIVPPSASKLAKHVDVRSHNSYVLVAPSRTRDGVYEWAEGSWEDGLKGIKAAMADEAYVAKAKANFKEKSEDHDNWIIEPDMPENVDLASYWLANDAQIAVEGRGGDALAYATAAHLKSYGISPELALDLMWEHWSPRCKPPWVASDLEHLTSKINNAYRYNTSPPGNVTTAYKAAVHAKMFAPVSRDDLPNGLGVNAGRFRFVDATGLGNARPPEWLIEDFLMADTQALMFGAPGTFKSFVALDIGLTLANGGCWEWKETWRSSIQGKGRVLYALSEGRAQLINRIHGWMSHRQVEAAPDWFHIADPVPHVGEDIAPFLQGALAMSPDGYDLVIIDTVGRSMQGLNENAQEHASKFTAMSDSIRNGLNGATVLGIHHTGHDNQDRTRGSMVFQADADTMVRVDRELKELAVSLTMTKQKDAEEWQASIRLDMAKMELDPDTVTLVPAIPAKASERQTKQDTKGRKRNSPEINSSMDDRVDEILHSIMKSRKSTTFHTATVARMLAVEPDIHYEETALRIKVLQRLRSDATRWAHLHYHPEPNYFKFQEGAPGAKSSGRKGRTVDAKV